MKRVSLIIPTYNGGNIWKIVIQSILNQDYPNLDVLVIDSGSNDSTKKLSELAGFRVIEIDASSFNHGGTRNLGVYDCLNHHDPEVVVFMTQDAILSSNHSISDMIANFTDISISAVCGRQLPHTDANVLAKHARYFNYPSQSAVKSIQDAKYLGIKTAFMSNSFAAYRVSHFNKYGGFPDNTILSEDMYMASILLKNGHNIAYNSEASVYHSHNYSPLEEFQRYFDIGVFHADESWIKSLFGGAGGEGFKYIKSELTYSVKYGFYWFSRSIITCGLKFLGYKLGHFYKHIPLSIVKMCSMHTKYWNNH